MGTYVDLSHPITEGMETYPGLPTPRIGTVLSRADSWGRYAPGVEFHIGSIELCTNPGTYLDTPSHRYTDGWDLSALPLDRCVDLPLVVVDVPPGGRAGAYAVGPDDVAGADVRLRHPARATSVTSSRRTLRFPGSSKGRLRRRGAPDGTMGDVNR